jgi:hypothetical protein
VLAGIGVAAVIAGCCLLPWVVMGVVSRLKTRSQRKVRLSGRVMGNPMLPDRDGERGKEQP